MTIMAKTTVITTAPTAIARPPTLSLTAFHHFTCSLGRSVRAADVDGSSAGLAASYFVASTLTKYAYYDPERW